ncbi:MAG: GntR family transcriptional regulator [Thomasclavelia sp.]|uniref:GntR family transcriptional regulator n=1 Tax=Thomasclavelia sp. TaxID=3025757 RepID=UPI00399F9AF7
MEIIIKNSSNDPIYQQITSQIKALIIDGTLKAGDAMPSMRNLAKSLHVSVITAQHAYEELQKDGFIETVAGKGTFVSAQNKNFIREEQLRIIEQKIEDIAKAAKIYDVSLDELIKTLTVIYEEE